MLQLNKLKCETEGCKNKAMGIVGGKWRCGECIARYAKKLKEQNEKLFLKEDGNN